MQEGLTTVGITAEEYALRRQRLFERMPAGSIALLPAAEEKHRNADTEYPFRQESNFYYLSGFKEAGALLVLIKEQEGRTEFILFCRSSEPAAEIWVGKRMGPEGAVKHLGADRAFAIEEQDKLMPLLLGDKQHIFYSLGHHTAWDLRIISWFNSVRSKAKMGPKAPEAWIDLLAWIAEDRLIKSPAEIRLMRKAAIISAAAHQRLIKQCAPNKMEYELEAEFLQACYQEGCRAMAYPSIIGGGGNACTLHYIHNDAILKAGELVLVDAGGEYEYYAADITRTFPINGQFTADQKSIYEVVLRAQLAAIEQIRPGLPWDKLQETIVEVVVQGLIDLGILKGTLQTLIQQKAYRPFYMHSSGHWLGLDVHDVGEYQLNGVWRRLEAGMVLTVEPGIYIAPGHPTVDKRWWGIGVRIEDDILVTKKGYEVLTADAPKTVEAIEKMMKTS